MEKSPLQFRQPRLAKNEKIYPHVRYNKDTEEWNIWVTKEDQIIIDSPVITIEMTREELDIIARIVAYTYHDNKDEYEAIASDLRKDHIYKDLRSINMWLNIQYQRLEKEDEQSKQKKRKYI